MIDKYLRLATREDIPALVRLCREFYKEAPYKRLKFNPEKVRLGFETMIQDSLSRTLVLVGLHNGKPAGMLIAVAESPLFSSELIAAEQAWYVTPEARNSRMSLMMVNAYEDWAKRIGADHIQMASLSTSDPSVDEFYKRKGYTMVETSYFKTLKGVL